MNALPMMLLLLVGFESLAGFDPAAVSVADKWRFDAALVLKSSNRNLERKVLVSRVVRTAPHLSEREQSFSPRFCGLEGRKRLERF